MIRQGNNSTSRRLVVVITAILFMFSDNTVRSLAMMPFWRARVGEYDIGLKYSPLLGGPEWLPLHVKVVAQSPSTLYSWDFVPLNATDPAVLGQLLSLQPVPGVIRKRTRPIPVSLALESTRKDGILLQAKGDAFCDLYSDTNLHLLTNNCWTFALRLFENLSEDSRIL
jgi:hypothetical protein